MLVVSSLRGRKDEMERYSIEIDEFPDFSTDNFLESIDFNDLFVGIDDGDSLPDLDLGEFSAGSGGEDSSEIGNITSAFKRVLENDSRKLDNKEEGKHNLGSSLGNKEDQEVSGSDESIVVYSIGNGRKSSKKYHGKRKVKVDWTPELHRRFVEVVEQLGVDKAVPSRILELMGIDCLTRHNIASHLQKYRSHRKHVLTREAEAKSWSQKRQMYTARGNSGGCKREMIHGGPWLSVAQPTMGFPPMAPLHHHFRPLHVWGHPPTTNQPPVNIWPKHVLPPPSLVVAPPLPTPDPSFWQAHQQHAGFTPYYFPPPSPSPSPSVQPPTRYEKVGVTGMRKTDHPATVSTTHRPLLDFHPSKESIDAVIGDVLSKPCQPLPLGLKPPALDSVMLQLNRNGVPKVPPLSLHNT